MSATQLFAAPPPACLDEGEAVLWRERRTPPFMQLAVGTAAMVAVAGIAAGSVWVALPALAAALAVLAGGRRLVTARYLEDQVLTDRRALVVPRVGPAYAVPLRDIASVELRGTKATFTGTGPQLRFSFVRRHRSLRRALQDGAPHVSLEQRWDPNCAG